MGLGSSKPAASSSLCHGDRFHAGWARSVQVQSDGAVASLRPCACGPQPVDVRESLRSSDGQTSEGRPVGTLLLNRGTEANRCFPLGPSWADGFESHFIRLLYQFPWGHQSPTGMAIELNILEFTIPFPVSLCPLPSSFTPAPWSQLSNTLSAPQPEGPSNSTTRGNQARTEASDLKESNSWGLQWAAGGSTAHGRKPPLAFLQV